MIELGEVRGVDLPLREAGRLVVAGDHEGKPALRAFPTMVDLGDGELLVGYDLSRDHHATPPMGFMTTRSFDDGKTWSESFALCAMPGYHVTGCLGLMKCPDGSLMCNLARAYYPAWRQHQSVSLSEAPCRPGHGSRSAKGAPEGSTTSSSAPGTRATTGLPWPIPWTYSP